MFIALYGINNIGKTHHAKRLVDRLRRLGKKAVYLKYPIYDRKPSGPFLNSVLRKSGQNMSEEELQLWFVLNRYQFESDLKKLLQKNDFVVAEDYIGTGIAWGMAKGAKRTELENMNKFLVQSDVSILMEGKRVLSSKEKGHIHEENDALAERCRVIFGKLGARYRWKKVRVHDDRDVTASAIWQVVAKFV